MNDLVSIVIPVFNRCRQVGAALDSVLEQTYPYWEAVVVDDGSTDNTMEVVEAYTRKDSRFRLLRYHEKRGAQAARNSGIRASEGRWITFLDSDDRLLPASLELRLKVVKQNRLEVIHSDCYVLKPNEAGPQQLGVPPVQGQVYKELLRKCAITGYFLFSKEAIAQIGFLDETLFAYQDWDLAIRLAKDHEFGFVPEPTFIWDCRYSDTISKDVLRAALGYEQVFRKHRKSILRYLGPKASADHYQKLAALYRKADKKAEAHRYLLVAILLWPFRPGAILRRVQRLFRWQLTA